MHYKNLLYEKKDGIGTVTISRPKVLNALNSEVFTELYELFQQIENDSEVRVAILTGSGEKAFVSGADISEMHDKDSIQASVFITVARNALDRIYTLSKPVIAAINGSALGGGCEITLCCDLRIASEKAKFGQPEINLGIVPGSGGMQRLARIIGMTKAKELVYTGDVIDASTALAIGLVNKVVPTDSLMTEAKALAQKLLSKSSVALSFAKKAINSGADMSLTAALDLDECFFSMCFASEDQKEGMKAFIEKRTPQFRNR